MAFKYRGRTREDMVRAANFQGDDQCLTSPLRFGKLPDGKSKWRILPASWDTPDNHYGQRVWVNFGIGPNNASFLSLAKMKNERDPIAEAQQEIAASDPEAAKELRPRQRVYVFAVSRDKPEDGVVVLDLAPTLDKAIIDASFDPDTGEAMLIDHPDKGHDVLITRTGKSLNTKYSVQVSPRETPISRDPKQQAEWLRFVEGNPIPGHLNFATYEHIAKLFSGGSERAAVAPSSRSDRRAKDDSDDDFGTREEVIDDPDEGLDTPPAKPKPKPKPKRRAKDDDDIPWGD